MEDMMRYLYEMTLYGSIAIVMVLVFRAVFRKIPKKVTCLFWIVVAIRLLCPINFSTSLGIANLFESEREQVATTVPLAVEQTHNTPLTAKPVMNDSAPIEADRNVTELPAKVSASTIMFTVWTVGAAVLLIIFALQYIRTRRLISEAKSENGVLVSDKVTTPFVAGIFKPVIVLPSLIDRTEREYLVCHEKVHIKNKDNLTRALGLIIVCIHWFNPLVWIAYKLMCNDLEMRVDEEVIDKIGNEIKKDYCMSIVNHTMIGSRYKVCGASFAKKTLSGMEVKMRINNLIRYKKVSNIAATLIIVASLGSTMVFSSCAKEKKEKPTTVDYRKTTEETEILEIEEETESVEPEVTEKPERKIDYTYRFVGDNDKIYGFHNNDKLPYAPLRMYGPVDSEYCKDYGEGAVNLYYVTCQDFKDHMNYMIVPPEYYEGTDFYDLALAYSNEGYAIADIEKAYYLWGGSYFAEGFFALSDAGTIVVARSDKDTADRYIREDCITDLVSYEEELIANDDGTTTLSMDYVRMLCYDCTSGEPVPEYGEDHIEAVLYDETGIAIIPANSLF